MRGSGSGTEQETRRSGSRCVEAGCVELCEVERGRVATTPRSPAGDWCGCLVVQIKKYREWVGLRANAKCSPDRGVLVVSRGRRRSQLSSTRAGGARGLPGPLPPNQLSLLVKHLPLAARAGRLQQGGNPIAVLRSWWKSPVVWQVPSLSACPPASIGNRYTVPPDHRLLQAHGERGRDQGRTSKADGQGTSDTIAVMVQALLYMSANLPPLVRVLVRVGLGPALAGGRHQPRRRRRPALLSGQSLPCEQ